MRSRAHALRNKLQEYYAKECPEAEIRIELPEGAYCPTFIRTPSPELPGLTTGQPGYRFGWSAIALAFLSGLALAACGFALWTRYTPADGIDSTLREAWGPLLEPGTSTVVLLATPAQLFVRQFPPEATPHEPLLPAPAELRPWYATRHTLQPGTELFMHPTHGSLLWGDAAAALTLTRVLAQARVGIELMPERAAQPFVIRGRNALVFGRPEFSPAVTMLLRKGAFQLRYDTVLRDYVILAVDAKTGAESRVSEAGKDYGLISVLPSEGVSEYARRTVMICGVTAAGTQAAAEYFASPAHLQEFRRRLGTRWPRSYQIIVKTSRDPAYLPLSATYVAHRVLGY